MEQTLSENLQLGQLVANALSEIERLGYSRRSRNRYREIWEHLIEFSRRNELEDKFSADLGARFLEEYGVRGEAVDEPGNGWRRHLLFGLKVLADFAKNGRIERAFAEIQAIHLHPAMQNTLRDYEQYCTDRLHLRGTSLRLRTADLTLFLHFLHSTKARRSYPPTGAGWPMPQMNPVAPRFTCSPIRVPAGSGKSRRKAARSQFGTRTGGSYSTAVATR